MTLCLYLISPCLGNDQHLHLLRPQLEKSPRKTKGSPPQPHKSLSNMSTDVELDKSWPLLAEKGRERIARYQPHDRHFDEQVQSSLNAFIDWLPEGGRESIARDCIKATTDDDLYQVFENLFTGLAIPMQARSKPPSVKDSPHPYRRDNVETIAGILDKSNSREHDFHSRCLQRDSYKCVITGEIDFDYWKRKLGKPDGIAFSPTEGAHIIPFSYASWENSKTSSHDRAKAWEVLYRCFPQVRRAGLIVNNIHDLSNGLTLRRSIHDEFGKFHIALKPTEIPNKYEVKYFDSFPLSDRRLLPESIELKQAKDAQRLDLPDRVLLDCHYRLAEILNASGLGYIIEQHIRRWKNLKVNTYNAVIREDGGSDIGEFLHAGLWQHVMG
ncbi:hypothetical protein BDV25DRAFT_96108 [Aspergillus avenaceus]|uniref:HNH nuclease domain-containing protein n=1 Tax=Aspergillus avenaceus TaxID=36643 RepID=A0A5N6TDQ8_ASPAV|nr:hypothetical protein BDV25DRAFT_96108 [Aspergillus avenaceus]